VIIPPSSRDLSDLLIEVTDNRTVLSPECSAVTLCSHAQLTLYGLGVFRLLLTAVDRTVDRGFGQSYRSDSLLLPGGVGLSLAYGIRGLSGLPLPVSVTDGQSSQRHYPEESVTPLCARGYLSRCGLFRFPQRT